MQPPSSIAWLVDAVGENAALEFIDGNAGKRLKIPRSAENCQLAEIYGLPLAQALVDTYYGSDYQVPLVRAWRAHLLAGRGCSSNEIATRLGTSWRNVGKLLEKAPVDRAKRRASHPGQLDIFSL
nr:hypothetical protein [uncultured Acetobacter sp.]